MNAQEIFRKTMEGEGQRKHRLRRLKLSELSIVDKPANQHARVVLAKRAEHDRSPPMFDLEAFDKRITEVRKSQPGLSYLAAMSAARRLYPADFRRYCSAPIGAAHDDGAFDAMVEQEIEKSGGHLARHVAEQRVVTKYGVLPSTAVAKSGAAETPVVAFMQLTSEIQKRDGCDRAEAMSRARRENPIAFAKLQEV